MDLDGRTLVTVDDKARPHALITTVFVDGVDGDAPRDHLPDQLRNRVLPHLPSATPPPGSITVQPRTPRGAVWARAAETTGR